jgi:exo-beta-1,3-glucanase (GH17 family)
LVLRSANPATMRPALLLCLAALLIAAWYVPNRPVDPPGGRPGEKFSSLSFSAYQSWESPLTKRFPTEAEADADMALVARVAGAVRTYAAYEGDFDTAALAQKHGVKVWQGIWLSGNRADNDREIARGIALANAYPDTIIRVVVGNEVLLRRDLPAAELIADIDRVKRAVHQPVAYADVWEFWKQFPEVAPHVDLMLIHLLPYWEDVPTGIDGAVAHVGDVFRQMRALFPGKQIAIGETGWPSQGRERADAVPSIVNETKFLRDFLVLSHTEHFDYNFIEAFDQIWKYRSEGIVGANWGIYDAGRQLKIPLTGAVSNDPDWRAHAAISVAAGLALSLLGLWRGQSMPAGRRNLVCVAGMALGGALGLAVAGVVASLYDINLMLAGTVNLLGQSTLAVLAMLRLSGVLAPAPARNGADATETVRALLTRLTPPKQHGAFEDLSFVFVWTAAVMQMLLWCDSRYREFPLSTFAVPLLTTVGRLVASDLPRAGGQREEFFAGGILMLAAIGSAVEEGPLNTQSLVWNACAVLLAVPPLLRLTSGRRAVAA